SVNASVLKRLGYEVTDTIKGAANRWGRGVGRLRAHTTLVRIDIRVRGMFLMMARKIAKIAFTNTVSSMRAIGSRRGVKLRIPCEIQLARIVPELPRCPRAPSSIFPDIEYPRSTLDQYTFLGDR